MRFDDLESARVAILGAGREGQAVWRQIRRRFPDKKISMFAESAIDDGFTKGLDPVVDEYQVGPIDVQNLRQFDVIVRSAGISPYREELQALRRLGVEFTTASNLWFAENPDAKTICISGTKGKSTTAALVAHLLDKAGVKTCLAGNIGRPMLDCDSNGVDWWVIELSSYQISDLVAEPDVAVILNLSDEHIDWHGNSARYREDKLRLAELAHGGHLIVNMDDSLLVESIKQGPRVSWFNQRDGWQATGGGVIGNDGCFVSAPESLPGEHNSQNLAAALTVVDFLGLEIPELEKALSSFTGLPHRLQFLGEKAGVRYIDDSISTTPVSVVAALNTCGCDGVVLLLGGMDRGLDWNVFSSSLVGRPPYAIITLPDNGGKISDCLHRAGVKPPGGLHSASGLKSAVALAKTLVPENGCVLLSPGAPSFPHFRDFEDRGDQFAAYAGIENTV